MKDGLALIPCRTPEGVVPAAYGHGEADLLAHEAKRLGARSVDGYRLDGEFYVRVVGNDWKPRWFRLGESAAPRTPQERKA